MILDAELIIYYNCYTFIIVILFNGNCLWCITVWAFWSIWFRKNLVYIYSHNTIIFNTCMYLVYTPFKKAPGPSVKMPTECDRCKGTPHYSQARSPSAIIPISTTRLPFIQSKSAQGYDSSVIMSFATSDNVYSLAS